MPPPTSATPLGAPETQAPQHADDALTRAFTTALAGAGDALGEMSGRRVHVTPPIVRRCPPSEIVDAIGRADTVVVGVYVGVSGSMTGHALLMLAPDGAHRLAAILLDGMVEPPATGGDPLAFDEMELSALQEVGNVTVAAVLNELGRHLATPVWPTPPQAVIEMVGSIVDSVLLDLLMESDEVLSARTSFVEGDSTIDGTILVLPHHASLAVLLGALGAGAA